MLEPDDAPELARRQADRQQDRMFRNARSRHEGEIDRESNDREDASRGETKDQIGPRRDRQRIGCFLALEVITGDHINKRWVRAQTLDVSLRLVDGNGSPQLGRPRLAVAMRCKHLQEQWKGVHDTVGTRSESIRTNQPLSPPLADHQAGPQ